EMVESLQREVGPVFYERTDIRLKHPVAKERMVQNLVDEPPQELGGEKIIEVSTRDGVKYILGDDSWLLIRPSGTEPVLRVYAEGRSREMVKALLTYGNQIAENVSK
ncbi:phosphoglucomutase/phosphomannomutase family protein, partial [bacterium]|nr:phosphoglucomutase/phosphomannomutase family protein [bacterium]